MGPPQLKRPPLGLSARLRMTAPKATPRRHHEIPNPIIVDAGSQFHAGYSLLRKAPPQSGVLLPTLQSASVAMELYLKALSAREVEVQESPLSQVVTIYAKAATRSHDPKR